MSDAAMIVENDSYITNRLFQNNKMVVLNVAEC